MFREPETKNPTLAFPQKDTASRHGLFRFPQENTSARHGLLRREDWRLWKISEERKVESMRQPYMTRSDELSKPNKRKKDQQELADRLESESKPSPLGKRPRRQNQEKVPTHTYALLSTEKTYLRCYMCFATQTTTITCPGLQLRDGSHELPHRNKIPMIPSWLPPKSES